jgi:hypothetical protein
MLLNELFVKEAKATPLKHGSTRGHMGEYLLGSAVVAKLIQGEDIISVEDVVSVMRTTSSNDNLSASFKGVAGDEIIFKNVIKNQKNIADARDVEALIDAMSEELAGAVSFANGDIYSKKWSKLFAENGQPDKILVKAAGEEDQKGTKADIFLIYLKPDGTERIIKGWSLKTGSPLIGQASPRTFENMEVFFKDLGITLQPIQNYEQDPAGHVVNIMKQVEGDLNNLTAGNNTDKEMQLVQMVTSFMATHVTRNDPRVYIVNLGRGDYSAQTLQKMRRNLENVNLEATLSLSGRPTLYVHKAGEMRNYIFMIRYSYNEPKTRPDGTTRPERHKLIVEAGPLFKTLATVNVNDVEKENV